MPFPFNKALDLKLLELVKENPCLYNPSSPKFADLDTREVVWQKIGDTLGRPAQMCKSRWVNMRDMMRRKLRERARNPGQHSYHYRYEEQLAFIIPHFKETNLLPSAGDFSEFEEICDTDETFIEQSEFTPDDSASEAKPSRRLKDDAREANNSDKNSTYDSQRELNCATDPLEVFLLTIGSTLRKFSPYYLNQAKSKIFQVVQDYELEQICNKEGNIIDTSGR